MNIFTFSPFGYEGAIVSVETDLRRGIPAVDIVGLADSSVAEARERMRCAIKNQGLEFPSERVLIALSPADLKKEGPGFDLPLALSVLHASDTEHTDKEVLVMGELELSGTVRCVNGIHAAITSAIASGITDCIVPINNVKEASIPGMNVYGVSTLTEAYLILRGLETDDKDMLKSKCYNPEIFDSDVIEINGIEFPKFDKYPELAEVNSKGLEALAVAITGHHHLLFVGGPGCGKTMLTQYVEYLLPCNTMEESQSVTRIHSLAGLLRPNEGLIRKKPFRMPHQTASIEGICGGGPSCRPGEISLAHNGLLFLDEAEEFRSSVLQMLRVPLENHSITLSRAGRSTVYPAHFQLVLAANPCPCGNYGTKNKICLCSARSVDQYWKKFSAPLLDRVSIRVFFEDDAQKSDFDVYRLREMISVGVDRQRERGFYNEDATPEQVQILLGNCAEHIRNYMDKVSEKHDLSSRRRASLVKLSQTIADIWYDGNVVKECVDTAIGMMTIKGMDIVDL